MPATSILRRDSAQGAFVGEQLKFIKPKVYEKRYPEFKGRLFVPISHEVPPGAATFSYLQWDEVGAYEFYSAYATDAPVSDVRAQEFDSKVRELHGGTKWTLTEIENAMYAGVSLQDRKLLADRRASEQKIDDLIASGDTERGLKGFLNHDNVPRADVADNAGGTSKLWADKTPDEILEDLNEPVRKMILDTNEREIPDTMLLPPTKREVIATTPRSDGSDKSILAWFLENNEHIKHVGTWHKLAGAGSGGTDRMVVYRRDEEVCTFEIPLEYMLLEPEFKALHVEQHSRLKVGGVIFYLPYAANYRDGF